MPNDLHVFEAADHRAVIEPFALLLRVGIIAAEGKPRRPALEGIVLARGLRPFFFPVHGKHRPAGGALVSEGSGVPGVGGNGQLVLFPIGIIIGAVRPRRRGDSEADIDGSRAGGITVIHQRAGAIIRRTADILIVGIVIHEAPDGKVAVPRLQCLAA